MQHAMLDPDEFWTVFKPVMDLMGVTPFDVYDGPGIQFQWSGTGGGLEIHFVKAAGLDSNEPWTVVKVGDDDEGQEFGYDVRFHVAHDMDAVERFWPYAERIEAERVRREAV